MVIALTNRTLKKSGPEIENDQDKDFAARLLKRDYSTKIKVEKISEGKMCGDYKAYFRITKDRKVPQAERDLIDALMNPWNPKEVTRENDGKGNTSCPCFILTADEAADFSKSLNVPGFASMRAATIEVE